MSSDNYSSPTTLLFFRYKLSTYKSMPLVDKWLKSNPQKSQNDLCKLIESGEVILKNHILYTIPRLSLSEAKLLAQKIQGKNGLEIKDRRYRLKKYRQCFVGSELVQWLIKNQNILEEEAIIMGKGLFTHNLISHVCNDHEFMNDFLFYRFNES